MTAASELGLGDRVAIVTGGTQGLGLAIARRLRESGCHVVVNYHSADDAAHEAIASMESLPGSASLAKGDVRDPEFLRDLIRSTTDRHGRLDILIHNAATFTPMPTMPADLAACHHEISLAIDPLLSAAPLLVTAMPGGGRVILISSNGSHEVVPFYIATGVAKAAAESLVRYLAVDLAPHGITVNAIATHMLDKGERTRNHEAARFLAERTPNGRLTRPEDVAGVVALLCTDEAAWVQGQLVAVDGGLGLLV